jgi:uncharacterized damage-inducible protein DinB
MGSALAAESARGKLAAKAVKLLRALAARTYYLLKESQPVTKRQPKIRRTNTHPATPQAPLGRSAVQIFAANDRINQILIEHLAPELWTAKPPGKVRSIAAIFTHMHHVRCKWIRLTAPHLKVPRQLGRAHFTPQQARDALAESAARCTEMLAEALGEVPGDERRVKTFVRDGWAKPWPAGLEMLCYMLAHEAHHRGQISMLAHQMGFPLPMKIMSGLWNWEKIWKDCGAPLGQ